MQRRNIRFFLSRHLVVYLTPKQIRYFQSLPEKIREEMIITEMYPEEMLKFDSNKPIPVTVIAYFAITGDKKRDENIRHIVYETIMMFGLSPEEKLLFELLVKLMWYFNSRMQDGKKIEKPLHPTVIQALYLFKWNYPNFFNSIWDLVWYNYGGFDSDGKLFHFVNSEMAKYALDRFYI
jgi:hypothetical protein